MWHVCADRCVHPSNIWDVSASEGFIVQMPHSAGVACYRCLPQALCPTLPAAPTWVAQYGRSDAPDQRRPHGFIQLATMVQPGPDWAVYPGLQLAGQVGAAAPPPAGLHSSHKQVTTGPGKCMRQAMP